jgi:hypothetical protein
LLEADPTHDVGLMGATTAEDFIRIASLISGEALGCQRLPGVNGSDPRHAEWLRAKWLGPVLLLSESPDLDAMCDFQQSKLIAHPWLNPAKPRRARIEEPSASTEETALAETLPRVHQVWIGTEEMPPRLAAYCGTVERAFPGWEYKLWGEADMARLAENAVMPEVVLGQVACNIGIRADVVRLEILRQLGGVYLDCDIEAFRDLRPLFVSNIGFTYADYFNGGPGNQVMAAAAAMNPVVCLYLERIARNGDISAATQPDILRATGPERLKEVLEFYVGRWDGEHFSVAGQPVGGSYVAGQVTSIYPPVFFPYWFTQGTWATFVPANYPDAWAAHHWEAGWMKTLSK